MYDENSPPTLRSIRACLEGIIPSTMATCSTDGIPNVVYVSQVFYVDERHVALSYQFFNKTRKNVLSNPHCTVLVVDPMTMAHYRLHMRYVRTEDGGQIFERMKAQLQGIASHTGMASIFSLNGADIYEVELIERVAGQVLPSLQRYRGDVLGAVRASAELLAKCTCTADLLEATLSAIDDHMQIKHSMVLMQDGGSDCLYTVASKGYSKSGIGSEIGIGKGVIGIAARVGAPVRIGHVLRAEIFSNATRTDLDQAQLTASLEKEVPYPGLPHPHSQLAVPIQSAGRIQGVLFVESEEDMRFGFEEEDALFAIAGHLGSALDVLRVDAEPDNHLLDPRPSLPSSGPPLEVKYYRADDSVFIDNRYLIKGVAGAVLIKLLRDFTAKGRTEFSNREIRLDPTVRLPDVSDNLETRLVLLQRRLQENSPYMRIEKTGRGRFMLKMIRGVVLSEAPA
jgi:adenylate cyclase